MRILILGGGGFVGSAVARQLAESSHEVIVFRRSPSDSLPPGNIREMHGDLARLDESQTGLRELQPDVVIHMIAMTQADAEAAVAVFRGHARRIIAASSQDVYAAYGRLWRREEGEPDNRPVAEDGPLRAEWFPYRGIFADKDEYEKLAVEQTLQAVGPDLPATILRLGMVHGEDDPQQRLYEYIRRMEDGRPAILLDTVKAAWRTSRVHVENGAAAIALAATDDRAAGRVYNVAEPHVYTEAEWVEAIGGIMQWPGKVVRVPTENLPPHLLTPLDWRHHLIADTARIRRELGYAEPVDPDEGLRRTVAWQRGRASVAHDYRVFDYEAEDAALSRL